MGEARILVGNIFYWTKRMVGIDLNTLLNTMHSSSGLRWFRLLVYPQHAVGLKKISPPKILASHTSRTLAATTSLQHHSNIMSSCDPLLWCSSPDGSGSPSDSLV